MVRIKARNPNVAKEPTLPVGQPDRPLSKCPFSDVAAKIGSLEQMNRTQMKEIKYLKCLKCFTIIF